MKRRLRVGVTGGIGSGKSAVTERLERLQIAVIDADVEARAVVAHGSEALHAIAEHFGSAVISGDGTLHRAALRRIVFADPEERRWLEALTHPLIAQRILEQLDNTESPYAVLSSPLLLEGSQSEMVDCVVVVDVPEDLQLSRTMARDDNDETLVRSIMAAQLPRQERLDRADIVIDNSGSLQQLEERVDELHRELLERAQAFSAH